ncbi:proline racemase family protein [Phytohabitans kaempferiae]|uniref:Proline racemase family protein n=1 Tax=Phytohabitans kaempferiae TaxID=1620943 RepID=A0ABV6M789_9ACTN
MARIISTIDYHTGGEPFRITASPPDIAGATVAMRRMTAIGDPEIDGLRRLLCFEPRGHADMYGGFIVPPDDEGADFGVLFWHKDGFSTACGHGTIALGTWAVESGRVASGAGMNDVVIDVPSGRVIARVEVDGDGRVAGVEFVNVPGFLIATDVPVSTSAGVSRADVSYGGAIYAQVEAASLGVAVEPGQVDRLIALGREIKAQLDEQPVALHPHDPRQSGIYGTVFWDDLGTDAEGRRHQRNVTVFADGEVDRSPCGSGTSARLVTLVGRGELVVGGHLVHDSIVGSRFLGTVVGRTPGSPADLVATTVRGRAFRTGEHEFSVDDRDDQVPGFVLR